MKILVTGGAGFIGSHIVDAYIKEGHDVVVVDNLSTGKKENINSRATFYKADIRNQKRVDRIFKKERPDVVNHHAEITEVSKSTRDPVSTLEVGVIGGTNVLRAFGAHSTTRKKFIFISSGGVIYGNPKEVPTTENAPASPISPYGLSKLLGETTTKFYSQYLDFPYLILRYANVYGPRQNPQGEAGVVAIFGALMKKGSRPTIFGDGSKTRDYVYVKDIVRANVLALEKGEGETLNLGTGIETSDQEIYEGIARTVGFQDGPIYTPFREGEVRRIAVSPRRAEHILGWTPKTPLQEGLANTIQSLTISL